MFQRLAEVQQEKWMLEEKVSLPLPETSACPRAVPKVKAKWTSHLCAFNIAEVLILELMPWSTCFRCIINVLQHSIFLQFPGQR